MRDRVLRAAHDIVEDDEGESELSTAAGDQHLADHATDMLDRELDESLEENAEQLVREIDLALARIDDGTYGTCSRCGQEIPDGAARGRAVRRRSASSCKRIEERA